MENYENDEPDGRFGYSIWESVENGLVWGPIWVMFLYVVGFAQGDPTTFQVAGWFWFGLAVVLPPFIVWRIGLRRPPGDRWRAAAILAYGSLPSLLLVLPDTWFSTAAGLKVVLPPTIAWGIACQLIAMRRTPRPGSPRVRALILAGGALIWGVVALACFGLAGLGFLMGVWEPPPIAWLVSPVMVATCLPFGIATGYGSVKMLGEAGRAWRQAPDATRAD